MAVRPLASLLLVAVLCAGCTASVISDSPTPTESPPRLEIEAAAPHDVYVTITEDTSTGAVLIDRTFTVRPGERLRFDDTLTDTARYDVSVRVDDGASWNRTITPGNRYVVRITSTGAIEVDA